MPRPAPPPRRRSDERDYKEAKRRLQEEWRAVIFDRDGMACRLCGRGPPEVRLELAHVTPTIDFANVLRHEPVEVALALSYRYDNLVTFCSECHNIQHRDPLVGLGRAKDLDLDALRQRQALLEETPEVREYLDVLDRIRRKDKEAKRKAAGINLNAAALFERILSHRGWRSPAQVNEGVVMDRFRAWPEELGRPLPVDT